MALAEEKLNRFKELLKMVNDGLSKEEFLEAFKNVINLILKREKLATDKLNRAVADLNALFSDLKGKTEEYTASELKDAINAIYEKSEKAIKEQENLMNFIRDKVAKIKEGHDGKPGKDGTDGKNGKDGKDGSPDTSEQIRDKLETLKGNERLEIKAIKDLQEKLDELKDRIGGRPIFGGGGFNKAAMDYRILDPYAPTGTINGVNTDFVLSKAPNPATSLKIYRGGALQSLTEDYTLSSKTITFLVAPVVGEIIKVEHRI